MRILLTGVTGYIGKRLLPQLLQDGHEVICLVRDALRFSPPESFTNQVTVIEGDLLDPFSLNELPKNIDAAYYLVHSMSSDKDYAQMERIAAVNFKNYANNTTTKQVIYLSGIVNDNGLSKHLESRKTVEEILERGNYQLTTLRAGIIIGSGSASFEIIRDLVEKLPAMITPKWLKTKCQPIAIRDVLRFLKGVLLNGATYGKNFDIGGKEVLSYKEMLLEFARVRGLKRRILVTPVMTPRLSSYWLYFVTSTSYPLACALVGSMKNEVVCRDNHLAELLEIETMTYTQALAHAFDRIENHLIVSSWKDAMSSGTRNVEISEFIEIPSHGCFLDKRISLINNREESIEKVWRIGGKNGWYYANTLWKIRGLMDKFVGGVGLRRGRTNENEINVGDALDFWRVLHVDKEKGRLLLFAEMRLPGEAWLEFEVGNNRIKQTATFRPKGLLGRLYWYAVLPFHGLVFKGMLKALST